MKDTKTAKRIAVVLMNMGGPKDQDGVEPFLYNLFSDRAIIDLPFGIRHVLAKIISSGRQKRAKENYQLMGGGSNIVAETKAQENALQNMLGQQNPKIKWQCFSVMRYANPRAKQVLEQVRNFMPDQVICLPLYPQFSTTTSASSLEEWIRLSKKEHWKTSKIYAYESNKKFILAHAQKIKKTWEAAKKPDNIRVLFSAHGLPEKIVEKGDPYPKQIETCAGLIAQALPKQLQDWQICYQSRVGRLKWIGPSTIDAVQEAGLAKKSGLLIVPIAFVSEHVETQVELDIEIANLAKQCGISTYLRVETLRDDPLFIACLYDEVQNQL